MWGVMTSLHWFPKLTIPCTLIHIHSVGYIVEVLPKYFQVDLSFKSQVGPDGFHYTCDLTMFNLLLRCKCYQANFCHIFASNYYTPDIGLSYQYEVCMTSLHWQTDLRSWQWHVHQSTYLPPTYPVQVMFSSCLCVSVCVSVSICLFRLKLLNALT